MSSLLQHKVTGIEFAFGILMAVSGGMIKSVVNNGKFKDLVKSGLTGFFVSVVAGLTAIEYLKSPTLIIASMAMAGYSGAALLDSMNVLGKTAYAFQQLLGKQDSISDYIVKPTKKSKGDKH